MKSTEDATGQVIWAFFNGKYSFEVVGIDVSPLALKVCKKRGLKKPKYYP